MKRTIIKIDRERCNGCGLCAKACHEGAIGMVDGKAMLLREDYCDGMGDCLQACPVNAITFEEREAPAYDAEAVKRAQAQKNAQKTAHAQHVAQENAAAEPVKKASSPCANGGCPGSAAMALGGNTPRPGMMTMKRESTDGDGGTPAEKSQSMLSQWPVQIKLVPVKAPFFDGADLLVAADCAAYAYADFHREFIRGRITLIGCPKLDDVDYSEKLTAIFAENDIRSVTVVRMEVPCCGGIENAVKRALKMSGKRIPSQVITISRTGEILD